MQDLTNRISVVTGGGSGIGRELVKQLVAAGSHVAACDLSMEGLEETAHQCEVHRPEGTRISLHLCDVSDAAQVDGLAKAVAQEHGTDCINLLLNNAGIGGGGSFVLDKPADWERTFNVCWQGVYNSCRSFLPLLIASDAGHVVNVSSVNGFWASMGPSIANTAYSAAKFAVKGFTEALITDLRLNAPHVKASVVMPGHIGTSIAINSQLTTLGDPLAMDSETVAELREAFTRIEPAAAALSDDDIRQVIQQRGEEFRDNAPTTAAEAATIILAGVHDERWRILVGDDAVALDEMVRSEPGEAYEPSFHERMSARGVFNIISS